MARRFVPLTSATDLAGLELPPTLAWLPTEPAGSLEAWIEQTTQEWLAPGQVLYLDDVPIGVALYAPAARVRSPGSRLCGPVSGDAVLLGHLQVATPYQSQGHGAALVCATLQALLTFGSGAKALEAYAGRSGFSEDFLRCTGFALARRGLTDARYRLELATLVTTAEPGTAQRLRGWLSPLHVPRPRPAQCHDGLQHEVRVVQPLAVQLA